MEFNPQQEIIVGKKAARGLQSTLRSVLNAETVKNTGALLKTKVTAKKDRTGLLDRLTITSPHYSFKLHYGFEGVKENGVLMSLPKTDHFNIAIQQSNALEQLANEITELRADQVVAAINF